MDITRRMLLEGLSGAPRKDKSANDNVVVVVYLRGGADGLNMVVPHASDDYYRLRPSVRVERPGAVTGGAIDLDGFFGLHPALQPLEALWQGQQLAVVHAAGSPHESRSHFDAQTIMETGVQDPLARLDGWVGRQVAETQASNTSAFRSVALAGTAPRSFQGLVPPLALTGFAAFDVLLNEGDAFLNALSDLYGAQTTQALQSRLATEVVSILRETNPGEIASENGAQYPGTAFAQNLRRAAQLVRAGLGTEFISVDLGGWDTHTNQNAVLNGRLTELAEGLQAFMTDLGSERSRVTTVVMTEFGRRAQENGSAGTDHGHGGLVLVLGGGVRGGQVYADWPGLAAGDLDRGDLQVRTDYRQVLSELLLAKAPGSALSEVFPGYTMQRQLGLF